MLSKVDTSLGVYDEAKGLIDWKQILADLKADYASLAEEKKIEIKANVSGLGPVEQGNPLLWGLVLRNLLDNALKYSPQGANIKIEITDGALQVFNSGVSVEEGALAHLSERFFRPAGQKVSGSGLGLSIVRRVAESSACKVCFENADGGFRVCVFKEE